MVWDFLHGDMIYHLMFYKEKILVLDHKMLSECLENQVLIWDRSKILIIQDPTSGHVSVKSDTNRGKKASSQTIHATTISSSLITDQ